MFTYHLLAIAAFTGLVVGAPYLGGHLYQHHVDPYFYLNPSPSLYQSSPYQQFYKFPYHQQRLVNSPIFSSGQNGYDFASSFPLALEELPEINQFHSEDAEGRVLYGFHGHNQARMEARDSQGRVRGSYSYVDPHGQIVRMDYWDDGQGFQARGSNIPKATYDVPSYTPEVQAARDQHLKLYQQILLSSVHAHHPNKVHEDDYPYIERPDGAVSSPTAHEDDDDTVEVGRYPDRPDDQMDLYQSRPADFPSYSESMTRPGQFHQSIFTFQNQNDEDLESIALDNPELEDLGRGAKSLETKDSKHEGSNLQDKMQHVLNNEEKKSEKIENNKTDKKEIVKENTDKIMSKLDKDVKDQGVNDDDNKKHNGFTYHFKYTLTKPQAFQTAPTFQKVSSVVASEPVPKDKKTSVHSVHPLPLHTMTSIDDDVLLKTMPGPSAVHDVQTSPYQSSFQRPLIIKSFMAPASAVHDSQVPVRRTNSMDPKTEITN